MPHVQATDVGVDMVLRNKMRLLSMLASLTVASTLVAAPSSAAVAAPVLWTYPSACGSATTLQECIDGAGEGDTVEIDTDTPINETAVIDKSLELSAAPGYHPVVSYGLLVFSGTPQLDVSVGGLAFSGGVRVNLPSGAGHSVSLDSLRVVDPWNDSGIAVNAAVPASVRVESSVVEGFNAQRSGIELFATHDAGLVSMQAVANRVAAHGKKQSGSGIEVRSTGTGVTDVQLTNNVVWDVANCNCGGSSGILVYRTGDGPTDVDVVGNTVVRSHTNAFYVYDTAAGGELSLDVFNNIFAKAAYRGLYLESSGSSARTVRAGFNALWKNARRAIWDGASPGAGNRSVNPRFVDLANGKFQLRRSSPLIDAGLTCSPGGVAMPDQLGKARLAGARVDLGALERGAATADGKALVGTSGPDTLQGSAGADILCGMGGADWLSGVAGPDFLDGGDGADVLVGGSGGDRLVGMAGADLVVGGRGPDRIYGGQGPDPCLDSKDGVKGNDLVDGGSGRDGYRSDRRDTVRNVEHRATCAT
ncbi:MAG: hypothetical protein OEW53_01225 [Actinomycetota bacterium]|nr:hypothetical protein [Actinomycetota bacterium]